MAKLEIKELSPVTESAVAVNCAAGLCAYTSSDRAQETSVLNLRLGTEFELDRRWESLAFSHLGDRLIGIHTEEMRQVRLACYDLGRSKTIEESKLAPCLELSIDGSCFLGANSDSIYFLTEDAQRTEIRSVRCGDGTLHQIGLPEGQKLVDSQTCQDGLILVTGKDGSEYFVYRLTHDNLQLINRLTRRVHLTGEQGKHTYGLFLPSAERDVIEVRDLLTNEAIFNQSVEAVRLRKVLTTPCLDYLGVILARPTGCEFDLSVWSQSSGLVSSRTARLVDFRFSCTPSLLIGIFEQKECDFTFQIEHLISRTPVLSVPVKLAYQISGFDPVQRYAVLVSEYSSIILRW